MNEVRTTPAEAPRAGDRWILAAAGAAALVPLILYHRMFARMFWFGDEFDLIDQIDRLGFWHWMWLAFAENFVPLFKLLWGGGVFIFGGSYAAMIWLLWLTHALNVVLLGRVMRTCGLPWPAVAFTLITFGLSSTNIETLAWSVQWSAVLSATFMLLALDSFFRAPFRAASFAWVIASALSFSRGVLTGPLLARASVWPESGRSVAYHLKRSTYAVLYLLPSVIVAGFIAFMVPGNHTHMRGHLGEMTVFGVWYYSLNPALHLLTVESWGWHTVMLLGLGKLALVGWSFARSVGRLRLFFVLLVAFDLGNAVLLGIGRYNTTLAASVSSRYQYSSMIGILPLAGYWLAAQWSRFRAPGTVRAAGAAAVLGGLAFALCLHWPSELDNFSTWRGSESRRILLSDAPAPPHSVPGIPFMEMDRARFLIAKYNLH
jgi:hypothetical protein